MLSNETTPTTGNNTSLSIIGGKFSLRVDKDTPGAIPRKLTKGKNEGTEVWEMKYSTLIGHIAGGRITSGEFPGVEIDIVDYKANDRYTINFPLDSRYLYDLIKRLPNVDTSSEVSLEVVEGKKKTRQGNPTYNLHVVQNGKALYDYYTEWKKDTSGKPVPTLLHGMPEPVHGPKGWSFEAQENWLLERFEELFADYKTPDCDIPSLTEDDTPPDDEFYPADEDEEDAPF